MMDQPTSLGPLPFNAPTVFISYSHTDKAWKNRLLSGLAALEQAGRIVAWDDRQIDGGAQWYDRLQKELAKAAVAVCLISPAYLTSAFVTNEEVPYLLQQRAETGMIILPVLIRDCPWQAFDWINPSQVTPGERKAIAEDFDGQEDGQLARVGRQILEIVDDPSFGPPPPSPPAWQPPDKLDLDRMPQTGADLFGRQRMLAWLDEVWESDRTHVVSLVAWAGVGKTALVNRWLARLAEENFRGARRVYAWSFHGQGTGQRITSADLFIARALAWFGDSDPTAGSPWQKGERLSELIRLEKTLLILDGLEPLQSLLKAERGQVQDPALGMLIAELARANPGLCLITTREPVADLANYPESAREEKLEQISAAAGRALLRVGDVRGSDVELVAASRAFGNHALALQLLATYLQDTPGQRISNAVAMPDVELPEAAGRQARRLMVAFAQRFGDGPELELLRLLGLFDRLAPAAALDALRAGPPIPGLTTHLQEMRQTDWLHLVDRLRQVKLLAPVGPHYPGDLDVHPLVREHFGRQLQEEYPEAWRAGNNRLYEYFKAAAPFLPDTLARMDPLFTAVAHGCAAGRHQEALDEVYRQRISRHGKHFHWRRLGAFGSGLAALASFFDPPWRRPVAGLDGTARGFILSLAGDGLQAIGRLEEAIQPMQAAMDNWLAQKNWMQAAIAAGNLSDLYLTRGNLVEAVVTAQRGVAVADRSGDAFWRMASRANLADAMHQAGRLEEANDLFQEAEAIQKAGQPGYPLLYSWRAYLYCDLLLSCGEYKAVLERAVQLLEWDKSSGRVPDTGFHHLALGRAHLIMMTQVNPRGDVDQAARQLERAIEGLRQAGTQDQLLRGLLARAALHRVTGLLQQAQRDLDEARTIAERGGMRLHLADLHLESARLALIRGNEAEARQHLATAQAMIEEMGYHRRDGEAAELEEALKV